MGISLLKLVVQATAYSVVLGALLILGAQTSHSLNMDHNEGLVEWLQFALLLGGAVVLALRHGQQGRWWRYLVVAGLFVLAMEEIDWAQPYLGYTPISILADNNLYGEMALHNSFGMEKYLRMLVLLALMAGGGTLLAKIGIKHGLAGVIDYVRSKLLLPGALFTAGIMVLIAGRIMYPGDFFDFDEFGELAIYAGVIWFLLSRPLDVLKPG